MGLLATTVPDTTSLVYVLLLLLCNKCSPKNRLGMSTSEKCTKKLRRVCAAPVKRSSLTKWCNILEKVPDTDGEAW